MIEKLSNAYAPSGREEEVRQIIISELSDFYKDIKTDSLGNLIIHKPGKKKIIALTAPMDEVGFVVTHKNEDNIVNTSSIGVVKQKTLHNISAIDNCSNLYISAENNKIADENAKINDFEFDLIDMCKANVLNSDVVSNTLAFDTKYRLTDSFCIGKALERAVSCSLLSNLARSLTDSLYEYYFIFTSHNYCDKKGAFTATNGIKIDELYNICCLDADTNNIKQGSGPFIILRDKMLISSKNITDKITLSNCNLLVTSDLVCEGGVFQKQSATTGVVSVGVPVKHLYSPNEVVDLEDVEKTYSFLLEMVLS